MELISNIMLAAGALGAAAYCLILSRRLKAFAQLDSGMGGAIAGLSAQVDDMTRALDSARAAAGESARALGAATSRAELSAQRIELLLASLHDLPDRQPPASGRTRVVRRRRADELEGMR